MPPDRTTRGPTAQKKTSKKVPPTRPRKSAHPRPTAAAAPKGSHSKLRVRAQTHAPSTARPQLSADNLQTLTAKICEVYKIQPKDFQLRAIQSQIEGQDIVVQAPTGSGKTALAAGPHLWEWPDHEKKFTLMVCPLLSLEEEMVQTFDLDFGLRAVALNSKNGACSPIKIREILDMKYQIILLSPEMLQSRAFTDRVLRNTKFMKHMMSMFIDEAHCIVHWGAEFRKQYGTLGKLRAFFPRGTPVVAVTATLTARVYRGIYSSLHFAQSDIPNAFINKGNDRPNVSIVARAFQHPLNSYADLDFLLPETIRCAADIPKTYLYVDSKDSGGEIIDCLISKLLAHPMNAPRSDNIHDRAVPSGIIRPFNANLSQEYRNNAMARFRAGDVRILVCTDAAGMGCNIPDIKRVIQWKLPGSFSQFIQRAGRAARGRDQTGIAILLVEKSAYSIDIVSKPPPSVETKGTKKKGDEAGTARTGRADAKQVREYAIAHGLARGGSNKEDAGPSGPQPLLNVDSADEGLLTFAQSATCRRKVWAEIFQSTVSENLVVPCCDICEPKLLDVTRPPSLTPERKAKNRKGGLPDLSAQAQLRTWRRDVFKQKHSLAQYDPISILDDDLITSLTTIGPLTPDLISELLKDKWIFWDLHGAELTAFVQTFQIVFTPLPPKPRASKPGTISVIDLLLDTTSKRPRSESVADPNTPKRPRGPEDISEATSSTSVLRAPYGPMAGNLPVHGTPTTSHPLPSLTPYHPAQVGGPQPQHVSVNYYASRTNPGLPWNGAPGAAPLGPTFASRHGPPGLPPVAPDRTPSRAPPAYPMQSTPTVTASRPVLTPPCPPSHLRTQTYSDSGRKVPLSSSSARHPLGPAGMVRQSPFTPPHASAPVPVRSHPNPSPTPDSRYCHSMQPVGNSSYVRHSPVLHAAYYQPTASSSTQCPSAPPTQFVHYVHARNEPYTQPQHDNSQ